MPKWNMNCKGAMSLIIIFNWVACIISIYFISVIYEHYEIGLKDVGLVRAEAQYEEKMRHMESEKKAEQEKQRKLKLEQ